MNFECSGNRLPVRGVEACILTADTYLVVALVGWLTLFQSSTIGTYIHIIRVYIQPTNRKGWIQIDADVLLYVLVCVRNYKGTAVRSSRPNETPSSSRIPCLREPVIDYVYDPYPDGHTKYTKRSTPHIGQITIYSSSSRRSSEHLQYSYDNPIVSCGYETPLGLYYVRGVSDISRSANTNERKILKMSSYRSHPGSRIFYYSYVQQIEQTVRYRSREDISAMTKISKK